MYNNFPDGHEWGDAYTSDQFYFYVYNLLGDPGLKVWMDTPKDIAVIFDSEIIEGNSNFVEIEIEVTEIEKENFVVAITDSNNNDSLVSVSLTDYTGTAKVKGNFIEGEYSITVSKTGYKPKTDTFAVISSDNLIISDIEITGIAFPGEEISISLQVKNPLTETANCTYSFTSESDYITFPDKRVKDNITILPNDSVTISINNILVSNRWSNNHIIAIFFNLTSNIADQINIVQLELKSPELSLNNFVVNNQTGTLLQGEENLVSIELINLGDYETGNFSTTLESKNGNGTVTTPNSNYQNILQNELGINLTSFNIDIPDDIVTGLPLELEMKIFKDTEELRKVNFSFPIGLINMYSPTIDSYGYVAIESRDSGSYEIPTYNWVELDNDLGGNGVLVNPSIGYPDGMNTFVDLPFDLQFYGEIYETITVSTEGYICPGESERIYFRNRTIPSGIGPDGMIAPFWDDLENGEVYTYFDTNLNTFTIEWSELRSTGFTNSTQTFQVIIFDKEIYPTELGDNKILFQYKEIENVDWSENYSTIGIENLTQTAGLLISYANRFPVTVHQLENETAILFTNTEINGTGIDDNYELGITNYKLKQNYPNPFNPLTKINYELGGTLVTNGLANYETAEIAVYNTMGQKVWSSQITDHALRVTGSVLFNGTEFNSGVYYYSLEVDGKKMNTKAMVLIK